VPWGKGRYERAAAELAPVAKEVVARAALAPGDRVLDLGCGTGNVALLAARAGAVVTGVDPAERLVEVARERVPGASFVVGFAEELPFADAAFDVVISVFGAIFAADAKAALAELVRVLRPGGQALVTAWLPEGPLRRMIGIRGRAVAAATGEQPPKRFPWQDRDALGDAAARLGARVSFEDAEATFTAESPEAYLAGWREHPMEVAARPALERAGLLEAVEAEVLVALRQDNEDPAAFRATSRYRIATIEPGARTPP
jgi:SAM-dependent methyltransferase